MNGTHYPVNGSYKSAKPVSLHTLYGMLKAYLVREPYNFQSAAIGMIVAQAVKECGVTEYSKKGVLDSGLARNDCNYWGITYTNMSNGWDTKAGYDTVKYSNNGLTFLSMDSPIQGVLAYGEFCIHTTIAAKAALPHMRTARDYAYQLGSFGWCVPYYNPEDLIAIYNDLVRAGIFDTDQEIVPSTVDTSIYTSGDGTTSTYSYYDTATGKVVTKTSSKKSGAVSERHITGYETKYSTVTHEAIETEDVSKISQASGTSLLSSPVLVSVPFVAVDIGGVKFGSYAYNKESALKSTVQYPNYVKGMTVDKVNGEVNSYSIDLLYTVAQGQDPNFVDKVLSKVGYGEITISYGDLALPSYIYQNETAIITNVVSSVDFSSNQITYKISAVSSCFPLVATSFTFPRYANKKPSDVIHSILFGAKSSQYGLSSAFPGLTTTNFAKYVATDDEAVNIEEKTNVDSLTYLNYLVSCMVPAGTGSSNLTSAVYTLSIKDTTADNGGAYFEVVKISSNAGQSIKTSGIYTVDVGYPTDAPTINFKINNDQSWALIYNYTDKASNDDYVHTIDSNGNLISYQSSRLTTSSTLNYTTASAKSWWTSMTQFPVTASLTVKGLLRPALLCEYVKVNAYIHGQKHTASGLYIITKQTDTINSTGYRTELSLTRVAGDTDLITTKTEKVAVKIPVWSK